MRAAVLSAAFAAVVIPAAAVALPQGAAAQEHACSEAPARRCHSAMMHRGSAAPRHRHLARAAIHRHLARYGRPFHIPRFSQAEAEAEVHTVYPYRTGAYAPWPDFYGTPYYPPY